jgi:hypothetical protein
MRRDEAVPPGKRDGVAWAAPSRYYAHMSDRLRRLDALFAERVLGRVVFRSTTGGDVWFEEDMNPIPAYTRSLDAAWSGVATLQDKGFNRVKLISDSEWADGQQHYAIIYDDNDEPPKEWEYCSHPAEALVLACLRAVGCSEEELA